MGLSEALEKARRMETCSTCGNKYDPENIPGTHPFRHPVNGALQIQRPQEQGDRALSLPSDPILRLILVNKGIITTEDIEEAEKMLKVSGMAISNPEATPNDS